MHLSCLRFQALYNYTPRNEDELELRESDVIDVMEKCDDGWFVGTCTVRCRHICPRLTRLCLLPAWVGTAVRLSLSSQSL